MVRNPHRTRHGEIVIGIPDHVDVIFRREPRIWYSEVIGKEGLMDKMDNEYAPLECYCEDDGNRNSAINSGMAIGAHHGIPINIFSGGKVIRTIKPKF